VEALAVRPPTLPARSAVFRAASGARLSSFVSQELTPFRWGAVGATPDLRGDASVARMGPLSLIQLRHEGSQLHTFVPEAMTYYDLHFAVSGTNTMEVGGRSVKLDETSAVIVSPRMHTEMRVGESYEQFHVRIERRAVERHLERLLGRPIHDGLAFDPRIDLRASTSRNWLRAVGLMVDDLHEESLPLAMNARDAGWVDFLISRLLYCQTHNYSDELVNGTPTRRAMPNRLSRVLKEIEERPQDDLSLSELARIAGVAERSLQRDFRVYLGVSPRRYVENVRLARAHSDLTAGDGPTIADIAFRWGFGHVSRFAASYRDRYGEMPSETLRG